ncbi:MAG: hypothetical protein GQ527_02605 [Bacteroidales bacterium]|nr:hypothetical protein [Bacteroidales bacterium]
MKAFIKTTINSSFGQWSIASLMISLFSGVFLIVPFDVTNAHASIVSFIIANPFAAFFRNLHYWSSQVFLVTTIIHIVDHILQKSENKLKIGVWLRLVLGIMFVYLVMLSGFLLKADADSKQAWEILHYLISSTPLIGEGIAHFILGNQQENLLIPYIHHVATFSLIIVFMIFEHARQLWPKGNIFVISIVILSFISSFWHAPLHLNTDLIIKGPWYFVGFQEILHWMNQPAWSILFIIIILIAIFSLQFIPLKPKKILRIILLSLGVFYLILTIIGFYFRGENWELKSRWNNDSHQTYIKAYPIWSGETKLDNHINDIQLQESCMWCHSNFTGFAPAHQASIIGCSSCHLGNKLSRNKEAAHQGMELFPGNFSNAAQTCGNTACHPNELEHIQKSLMSTNSGLVAVDKFVFYESNDLNASYHIKAIGHSPAETHLRNLCASCHLGNDKLISGPITEKSRGGGCLACHLNYPEKQLQSFQAYQKGSLLDSMIAYHHPQLNLEIDNSHCFGCHSRSGRISTNYEGWHETLISHKDFQATDTLRLLEDKRVFQLIQADVHHEAGLVCIDCHQYKGVMGDGENYTHQEQAVKIQCIDCHSSSYTNRISYSELDREEENVFNLRGYSHQDKPMIASLKGNTAIINTIIIDNNQAVLLGKKSKKTHELKATADVCTSLAHQDVSCSLCHSAWVPQCIGCHQEYDANDQKGYDHLKQKKITGEWNELIGKFFADLPVIGVRENKDKKTYEPSTPGMIMTIDTASFYSRKSSMAFHRLYAPASPHTTHTKARNCKSCHQNSLALGLGRGELDYELLENNGIWKFNSFFAHSKYDQLPQDAWIDYSDQHIETGSSTRSDFRSLNNEELRKILLVGACLNCHSEDSEVMIRSLNQSFDLLLKEKTEKCKLPVYSLK